MQTCPTCANQEADPHEQDRTSTTHPVHHPHRPARRGGCPVTDARNPNNGQLRLAALLQQFLNLSTDQGNAGRVIFRGPNGEYIGEAKLSARDIEAATDALYSLTLYRQDMEEATRPDTLPEVDGAEMAETLAALENLANRGEQQ